MKKISTLVGVIIIIIAAIILVGGVFAYQYFSAQKNNSINQTLTSKNNNTNQTSIISISPNSAAQDATVIIIGSSFDQTNNIVSFEYTDPVPVSGNNYQDKTIDFTLPSSDNGTKISFVPEQYGVTSAISVPSGDYGGGSLMVTNKTTGDKSDRITFSVFVPVAIAGWKTYTNTQYGFQLEYPEGTKLPDHTYGPSDNAIRFQPVGSKENAPDSFIINITSCSTNDPNSSAVVINGISFTKYDLVQDYTNIRFTEYCTNKNGVGYLISMVPPKNVDVSEDPILNRVISSFKFTK